MIALTELLRRFTIRLRMLGAIGLVLALLAAVGGVGVWSLNRMAGLAEDVERTTHVPALQLSEIRAQLGEIRRYEKDMLINIDKIEVVIGYKAQWDKALEQLHAQTKALQGSGREDLAAMAGKVDQLMQRYADAARNPVRNLEAGSYDSATAANRLLANAKQHVHAAELELDAVGKALAAHAQASREQRLATARRAHATFAVVLVLAALLVVPSTLANMVSICRPIEDAQALAKRIADGDLTGARGDVHPDEPGSLLRALARMQESLRGIVAQVRESADSIQLASGEVASGNQNLSQRTEQAASSLQQTASSMEQITGTVRQSADSAAQANQLAISASEVAQRGGTAVAQVVQTMNDIAASSQRIADIIGTIDGIAFQTNILALNAAVEAARAGEQGRGFAVVAGEVRTLAQRSAEAAREIKALIGASVERVGAGAALVHDAGATMNDIVAGVQRVSHVIGEVTQAASQQNTGIGQINAAVSQLDRMTQENAALVEQAAAAADALKDQSQRLAHTVAGFRLGGT